ncbi:hypothetical protein RIVM261_027750 [Rivularia sp. IAM M-261]|nr:hypothetical protein CAL7716_013150 [Calothrix sp. PCC 7716]GJD17819.1 hypothetical protein RIVM261_027750 [Rivularia sp. IAM M-261]
MFTPFRIAVSVLLDRFWNLMKCRYEFVLFGWIFKKGLRTEVFIFKKGLKSLLPRWHIWKEGARKMTILRVVMITLESIVFR